MFLLKSSVKVPPSKPKLQQEADCISATAATNILSRTDMGVALGKRLYKKGL